MHNLSVDAQGVPAMTMQVGSPIHSIRSLHPLRLKGSTFTMILAVIVEKTPKRCTTENQTPNNQQFSPDYYL